MLAVRLARRLWLAYRYPLLAFCISRLALLVVVYLGLAMVPLASGEGLWRVFPDNLFLDGFGRWDSGWYFPIAENGYTNFLIPALKGQKDTAFFPAYPFLLSIVGSLGWRGMQLWGIAASNFLFGLGLCFLFDISKFFCNTRVARLAVSLAAFSPFSIFFSSIYTESLFFAASTASFWFSIRSQLAWAMLAASLASVTRVVGIICVPFAFLSFYFPVPLGSQASRQKRRLGPLILPATLTGASLLFLHLIYLQLRFGNAFQFVLSQRVWATESGLTKLLATWYPVFDLENVFKGQFNVMGIVNSASLAVAGSLVVLCFVRRWLPLSLSVWSLLTILVSSSLWFSGGRFISSIFPLYVMLALLLRRCPAELVVGVSALLMSLFAFLFSHWYWVA